MLLALWWYYWQQAFLTARDPYATLVHARPSLAVYLRVNDADGIARDDSGHQNNGLYVGSVTKHVEGAIRPPNDPYAVLLTTDALQTISGATIDGDQVSAGIRPSIYGGRKFSQELWFEMPSATAPDDVTVASTQFLLDWGGYAWLQLVWVTADNAVDGVAHWALSGTVNAVEAFIGGTWQATPASFAATTQDPETGLPLVTFEVGRRYYAAYTLDFFDGLSYVATLYLNGLPISSNVGTFGVPFRLGFPVANAVFKAALWIGHADVSWAGFEGWIDEVAAFGSVGTPEDIAAQWALRRLDTAIDVEMRLAVARAQAWPAAITRTVAPPLAITRDERWSLQD